jgi:hypothetical protein
MPSTYEHNTKIENRGNANPSLVLVAVGEGRERVVTPCRPPHDPLARGSRPPQ